MYIIEIQGGLMKQMEKRYPTTRIRANIVDRKHYELNYAFGIELNECSWKAAASLADDFPQNALFHTILGPLSKIRQVLFGHKRTYIHQDDYTCFYPEYYQLNPLNWYYFKGVWANSQYLIGVENDIKRAFNFEGELTEINKKYIFEMAQCDSVSIHVRRGDYIKAGSRLLDQNYYKSAIQYMNSKINNPKFFVFSNDIEYCKGIFNEYKGFVYIEGNTGNESFRDMQLMSQCKHNIIANSTFSFWGAYLNDNPAKIVIAPNIGVGTIDFNTPFACPEWIKIDV